MVRSVSSKLTRDDQIGWDGRIELLCESPPQRMGCEQRDVERVGIHGVIVVALLGQQVKAGHQLRAGRVVNSPCTAA